MAQTQKLPQRFGRSSTTRCGVDRPTSASSSKRRDSIGGQDSNLPRSVDAGQLHSFRGRMRAAAGEGPSPKRLEKQLQARKRILVEVALPHSSEQINLRPTAPVHAALHEALKVGGKLIVSFEGKEILDDGSTLNDHGIQEHSRLTVAGGGTNLEEQKVFVGHEHWVFCVAALRDGGTLASGAADKTIRLWDIAKGSCTKVLTGHDDAVVALCELRSGQIVSASYDKTMRLWDIFSGKCTRVLKGHEAPVFCVIQLCDGRLASGSDDTSVRLWDGGSTTTGRRGNESLQTLQGHSMAVTSLVQLREGRLASSSDDKTVCLWDTKNAQKLKVLQQHAETMLMITAFTDGRLASCSADGTIQLWDKTGQVAQQVLRGHSQAASKVIQLSDEDLGVSCSFDQTLCLWNLRNGECIQRMEGHEGMIYNVVEIDGGRLASCSTDMTIRIWG